MTALEKILEFGLTVEADGDRLIVRPKGKLTEEVRQLIRERKPEILSALRKSLPERVSWESPLFGRLSAGPVLEMTETHFSLIHPLTGEKVVLSREWLVSLDERSAIFEFDAGMSREKADQEARKEFFGLFRKGGSHEKRD